MCLTIWCKTVTCCYQQRISSHSSDDDDDEDWSERLLVREAPSSGKLDNWVDMSTSSSADNGLWSDTLLLPSAPFGIHTACSATVGSKRMVHFSRRLRHSWQLAVERYLTSGWADTNPFVIGGAATRNALLRFNTVSRIAAVVDKEFVLSTVTCDDVMQ